MTNLIETKSTIREESVMERINKTNKVFICYDSDDKIQFGTVSHSQASQFARLNKCNVSEYPIGTFTND